MSVQRRGRSQSKNGPGLSDLTDELIDAYRNRRVTQIEIADRLGVTRAVIAKALKARGVGQDRSKPNTAGRSKSSKSPDLAKDKALSDAAIKDGQKGYEDTFLNILKHDQQEIEKYSKRLDGYANNLFSLWMQVQGAVADIFVAEREGRVPRLSPKVVGQLARILETLGPNPIEHWQEIVLPQQQAMAAVEGLPALKIEIMKPEDVAAVRREQEKEDAELQKGVN